MRMNCNSTYYRENYARVHTNSHTNSDTYSDTVLRTLIEKVHPTVFLFLSFLSREMFVCEIH